jgi:hypothetical protein
MLGMWPEGRLDLSLMNVQDASKYFEILGDAAGDSRAVIRSPLPSLLDAKHSLHWGLQAG